MKIVKTILTVLVILLIVLMTINVFIPASFRVQRYVELDSSPKKIYNYLRDFNNFTEWNSEVLTNSSVQIEGAVGEVGNTLKVVSDNQNLDLTITELVPTSLIKINLNSEENKSFKVTYFKIEPIIESGKTKLTYGVQGRRAFPFRFYNLMMDKSIAKELNKSLSKLAVRFKPEY